MRVNTRVRIECRMKETIETLFCLRRHTMLAFRTSSIHLSRGDSHHQYIPVSLELLKCNRIFGSWSSLSTFSTPTILQQQKRLVYRVGENTQSKERKPSRRSTGTGSWPWKATQENQRSVLFHLVVPTVQLHPTLFTSNDRSAGKSNYLRKRMEK